LTNIGNPDLVTFFSLFLIIVLDVGNLDENLGVIVMAYVGSFNENWGYFLWFYTTTIVDNLDQNFEVTLA
jgi:hypothetical protein